MLDRLFRRHRPRSTEADVLVRACETRIELASQSRVAAIARTIAALPDNWQGTLAADTAFIVEATAARDALRRSRQAQRLVIAPPAAPLRFQASSLFLRDSWKYLTGDPQGRERMHLVTGSITPDGLRILSRIEPVTMAKQSPAYVEADRAATHKQIVQLDRDGHRFFALFHSHISTGPTSTKPSSTDLANQDRFVQIGWDDALAGIVSLDGYFRLFSTCKDFELDIYGTRFEHIEDTPRSKILKLIGET